MKIAIVVTDAYSAWHFRGYLIRKLIENNHTVSVITPYGDYVKNIQELGANHISVKVNRFMNPIADLKFFLELHSIYKQEQFDVVHHYSIKPIVYGSIAGRLAGIKWICGSITGLGLLFLQRQNIKAKCLKYFALMLYRIAFKFCDRAHFQNPDDLELFLNHGIVKKEQTVLIESSGVPINVFSNIAVDQKKLIKLKKELGWHNSTKLVSMIARPMWSKGVKDFIKASHILGEENKNILFILVGGVEQENPDKVSEEYLKENETIYFKYLGWRSDIREILELSTLVSLPSCYREGVPKSLIEALAMGKPIVTTMNVGCKETVEHGKNGYLVPCEKPKALATAIKEIVTNKQLTKIFGEHSRQLAVNKFDINKINSRIIFEVYGIKQ